MTLSASRQQFMSYDNQSPEEIHYGRKGGVFISTWACICYVLLALIFATVVGVIVYYMTYFKVLQTSYENDNETEPFGQLIPSADLRLPPFVVPSFYRLKLKTNLDNSSFSGEVYITIRANKNVKEIILHSKDLKISSDAKLTELVYEKVEALQLRTPSKKVKRETVPATNDTQIDNSTISTKEDSKNITNLLSTEDITNSSSLNTETTVDSITTERVNETVKESSDNTFTEITTQQPIELTETPTVNLDNIQNTTDVSSTNTTDSDITTTELTTEHVSETSRPGLREKPLTPLDTQVTHSSNRDIRILSITYESGDRLVLSLASALKPGIEYTLELLFNGNITNSLTGFYKSSYLNNNSNVEELGVTQFEPTSARAAFPCFDEPQFKAKFEISIAHNKSLNVLSNMKISSEEDIVEEPGWMWTHFERSVNMSTYLVAYVLSNFQNVETNYTNKDNVTKSIKVWARPELISLADYALNITPKLLNFYEDLFGVPYALDKLDLVAIPDFASGAMENWGLITFRETALLYNNKDSSPKEKQNVAIDIAHELAHQWFGNLVTMRWWTDLWLNEGFATYVEYVGVDKIEPQWKVLDMFSRDKMELLRTDSLKNTSPVSKEVIDASEISQKFDEISYTKGANLIRMLNHTVTEKLFQKGLAFYLKQWKYSNAEENDLWEAITNVTKSDEEFKDLSVVDFMNTWTKQAGYPVVTVERNYDSGNVVFSQKLFTTTNEPHKSMVGQLWQVPISFVSTSAPAEEWSTKPKVWLKTQKTFQHLPMDKSEALYVNVDAIGYYRVNYDQKNWQLLGEALKSKRLKSPITRAQLMDDAFNLAQVSQLDYSRALELTTHLMDGEESQIVWDVVSYNMHFLRLNLVSTSGYHNFQDYMKLLIDKRLKSLNYGLTQPKDDVEAMIVGNLVAWECSVEAERCVDWASKEFRKWMAEKDYNTNPIPNYLRYIVYGTALKFGGRREFDFLWNVFQNTSDPNIKSLIISVLPTTREESLITMMLEKSLTDMPKQYVADVWDARSAEGARLTRTFFMDRFDEIHSKFAEMDPFVLSSILSGAFERITSEDDLNKVRTFVQKNREKLRPISQTVQKVIDSTVLVIDWKKRHSSQIIQWMQNYLKNTTNSEVISNHISNSSLPALEVPKLTSVENLLKGLNSTDNKN